MKRKERIKKLLNNQFNDFTMKIVDNSYQHMVILISMVKKKHI